MFPTIKKLMKNTLYKKFLVAGIVFSMTMGVSTSTEAFLGIGGFTFTGGNVIDFLRIGKLAAEVEKGRQKLDLMFKHVQVEINKLKEVTNSMATIKQEVDQVMNMGKATQQQAKNLLAGVQGLPTHIQSIAERTSSYRVPKEAILSGGEGYVYHATVSNQMTKGNIATISSQQTSIQGVKETNQRVDELVKANRKARGTLATKEVDTALDVEKTQQLANTTLAMSTALSNQLEHTIIENEREKAANLQRKKDYLNVSDPAKRKDKEHQPEPGKGLLFFN